MTTAVTLYAECDYKGWAVSLAPGNYTKNDLAARGVKDNQLSALKIANAIVILYQNDNYTGKSKVFTGPKNISCLKTYSFNNETSSIQVIAIPSNTATILYRQCADSSSTSKDNWVVPLPEGQYKFADLKSKGVMDNKLSSLYIYNNVIVTLYQNDNFGGKSRLLTGPASIACLKGSEYDFDTVTSIKIEKTPSDISVILYDEVNYNIKFPTAWKVMLPYGDYTLENLKSKAGFVNNDLGSLKIVKPNTVVTLYDSTNFTGKRGTIKSFLKSSPNLKTFNDKTSSIIVKELVDVFIYQHCNYKGWNVRLPVGEHRTVYLQSLGFVDNQASSLKVAAGFEVILYQDDNFKGPSITLTKNTSCFTNYKLPNSTKTFDNRVSSIKVRRIATTSPAPDSAPAPAPGPNDSYYPSNSHIASLTSKEMADTNGCAVYYTNMINACDSGVFNLHDKEIKKQYGNNQEAYNMIMNEKKKLPEPGVCKVKLYNWKLAQNSPILNAMEPGLANRGNPSDWAYCFQPLQGNTTMETIQKSMQGSTALTLHPSPLTGVFGDNLSYARLAFKKLDYASVKNDACAYVNNGYMDQIIPSGLIGIRVNNNMKITKIGVYKIENGKMVENPAIQMEIFKKLYKETLNGKKLIYSPIAVSSTIFVLGRDVCGNATTSTTASAVFNIGDFGATAKQLYQFSSKDSIVGTITDIDKINDNLLVKREEEITKYNGLTDQQQKIISKKRIDTYTIEIDKQKAIIKTIKMRMENVIKEEIPKVIGKNLHRGIPSILISSDSALYMHIP